MREVAISTFDNPYDPFEDFAAWYMEDCRLGYGSCQILDRLTNTFEGMTDKEYTAEMERAIDSLVSVDPANIFTKVVRETSEIL